MSLKAVVEAVTKNVPRLSMGETVIETVSEAVIEAVPEVVIKPVSKAVIEVVPEGVCETDTEVVPEVIFDVVHALPVLSHPPLIRQEHKKTSA